MRQRQVGRRGCAARVRRALAVFLSVWVPIQGNLRLPTALSLCAPSERALRHARGDHLEYWHDRATLAELPSANGLFVGSGDQQRRSRLRGSCGRTAVSRRAWMPTGQGTSSTSAQAHKRTSAQAHKRTRGQPFAGDRLNMLSKLSFPLPITSAFTCAGQPHEPVR